ncbi:MAG: diguanylate cyclase [Pseudomonadota bacterium]
MISGPFPSVITVTRRFLPRPFVRPSCKPDIGLNVLIVLPVLISAWLILSASSLAMNPAGPLLVLDERDRYQVGHYLVVLMDPEKALTIQEVSSPDYSAKFKPVRGPIPNFGIIKAAVWARFTLKNPRGTPADLLLSFNYPVTDSVTFFQPQAGGGFIKIEAGDAVPNFEAVIRHRYFVFPLSLQPRTSVTCYLRVQSTAAACLPLTLWTNEAFARQDHQNQLVFGLLFGAIMLFVLYFGAVAASLRNASYWWFALYITWFGLLLAVRKGFIQELLGNDYYYLNDITDLAAIGFLYFTGAKLMRTFLNVRTRSKRIDNILFILQNMGLFFIPMAAFPNPLTPLYSIILVGLGPIFSTTVSMVYWFKGVPNARYFALGWLAAHVTSLIDLLRISGAIPYLPFMDYILPVSLGLTLVFFALAIIEQTYTYQLFSRLDPLTGLANRRHFNELLETEWNRNLRHQRPVSIIMADVDFFKAYNDRYGHRAGDDCLMSIAGVLKGIARRPGDVAARYGGEEFVLLLAETDREEAAKMAENMRQSVEKLGLSHKRSPIQDVVTVSFGVAARSPERGSLPAMLVQEADEALYLAKQEGRNRVVVSRT